MANLLGMSAQDLSRFPSIRDYIDQKLATHERKTETSLAQLRGDFCKRHIDSLNQLRTQWGLQLPSEPRPPEGRLHPDAGGQQVQGQQGEVEGVVSDNVDHGATSAPRPVSESAFAPSPPRPPLLYTGTGAIAGALVPVMASQLEDALDEVRAESRALREFLKGEMSAYSDRMEEIVNDRMDSIQKLVLAQTGSVFAALRGEGMLGSGPEPAGSTTAEEEEREPHVHVAGEVVEMGKSSETIESCWAWFSIKVCGQLMH
mmetsp:Transcript_25703/g.64788  ORF Transcript_25703/g.64788 Transcript_25703/m.64788 type:complete len:259 (+) Transcript_25703:212-988(+)|eukprot:CAMPEP_0178996490 /NCGR_PEP_ID=MMETSP0795-20121207/8393_1 /TAXON_ID=88552 /ORGANISM="Amoebophrya sp., Strain Ameob2" /LENGTH=258 /DNA_ID=CAMNT_0020688877 /DNA_START=217 /DNA_END=993 /DNA_ORIENTATION=+